MMKGRIISALLSIFMMLMSNTLRADNVISQFHILGGELSNSAATSVSDIDEVLPRMKVLGLNTVLVPVYWEFLEPVEGQMDFTLFDRTIDVARKDYGTVPWFTKKKRASEKSDVLFLSLYFVELIRCPETSWRLQPS